MKTFVVFGSSSDEYIYGPLVDGLKLNETVDFDVISAHRNPEKLGLALSEKEYDFVVAGAGLAAHLPGVVASQTDRPVFGVPVPAVLGGLDALFSIMQMPFGVPVICSAPKKEFEIKDWVKKIQTFSAAQFSEMNLIVDETVLNYEYAQVEIERTQKFAKENEIFLNIIHKPQIDGINIVLVSAPEMIEANSLGNALCLHTILLDKSAKESPRKGLEIFNWIEQNGGLWVGSNNTRNALKALTQWRNIL